MIIITSPAKSLEEEREFPEIKYSTPRLLDESDELVSVLKKKSKNELKNLFNVSDKLAELNYERFQAWNKTHNLKNSRPAIFSFNGDIYREIDNWNFNNEELIHLNSTLRILSGLYGVLRPFDLIQSYRLEMGTKLNTKQDKNLYEFWDDNITSILNDDLKETKSKTLVNLGSEEYYKSVNFDRINSEVVEIKFIQERNGKEKSFGLLNKRSRGKLINWIVKNKANRLEEIKDFDEAGYKFVKEENNKYIFKTKEL